MTDRYTFTTDWFSAKTRRWEALLAPWMGRPGVRYLEVGVFEGRSLLWMLERVLTAPDARATAVDGFYPEPRDYGAVFRANLAASGLGHKVDVRVGDSHVVLRELDRGAYDVAYVDGSHLGKRVFMDLAHTWDLVKVGGLVLIDDYLLDRDTRPRELRPGPVVDAFLEAFGDELEVVHRAYDLAVRKVAPAAARALPDADYNRQHESTALGEWVWFWEDRRLRHATTHREVDLGPLRPAFERLLRAPTARRWLARLLARAARPASPSSRRG